MPQKPPAPNPPPPKGGYTPIVGPWWKRFIHWFNSWEA